MNAIEAYSMGFLTLDEFRALQHGESINRDDILEHAIGLSLAKKFGQTAAKTARNANKTYPKVVLPFDKNNAFKENNINGANKELLNKATAWLKQGDNKTHEGQHVRAQVLLL